ncbi:MAG: hypothetical protein U1E93_03700 [Alphaproteobacteria bacterium]
MPKTKRTPGKLNRFAIVLDTLMATHGMNEPALLKAIGKRKDQKSIKSIRSWRTGRTRPRAGKYLNVLEALEQTLSLPVGRLANLSGARASVFYRVAKKFHLSSQQLLRWHMPDDFDVRPEAERQEIMDWISANVLPCGTAFGKYQSKNTRTKFAVVFPNIPREIGGRSWMGHRLKQKHLVEAFKLHGTLRAPPRLEREMLRMLRFHTASLPPKGYRRRKKWTNATARTICSRYGIILGALAAPADRHVRGLGVPVEHLTMGLFVFPDIWEWYLRWYEKRRGFFSNSEKNALYDIRLLTRKPTGWIRQHPYLATRLKPIDGLLSQKEINRAKTNWGAACDRMHEYASNRLSELIGVIRMHRDPFAPILPVLAHESPLSEYKKIGDELLRRLPDERRFDDRRRLMAESTTTRNYLMFRFALHLGLRQRNLRELLLCPPKQKPRDTSVLEDLQRGEIRWSSTDKQWEVYVPAIAIKNGAADFFRGRPFQAALPDLEGLYGWIGSYLKHHRGFLLNGSPDPQTFFVRTMREPGDEAELNITSYYAVWKLMIQKYGIYNPYTKRGAIKGLLPHGPHAVRDILATHLLKTTGSYELASFAIQDSMASVMQHYARFLPHEKVARAAEELNKVWRH